MFKPFKTRCQTFSAGVLKSAARLFGPFLYPLKCLKCGVYIDPETVEPHTLEACFCDHCMGPGVYPIDTPFCMKCGVKFHQFTASNVNKNHVCESCLKTPLKLGQVRAATEYKGIIKEAIPLFKYQSKLSLAKVFENLLFHSFLQHYASARLDLILPVPLHKKKLRERGFNQAFLIIRNFMAHYQQYYAQAPSWQIDMVSLSRIKKTKPQTGFDIEQRKNNLKNAFSVINQKAIENKHILLIDDVFTTGATCNAAARELLKCRAKKVDALVLART